MSESVGSLFVELDYLLDSLMIQGRAQPTIIVPKVPDPTWFPRWYVQRTSSSDRYGQLQRQAVLLTAQWYDLVGVNAEAYKKANIILPEFIQWSLDLIREPEEVAQNFTSRVSGK